MFAKEDGFGSHPRSHVDTASPGPPHAVVAGVGDARARPRAVNRGLDLKRARDPTPRSCHQMRETARLTDIASLGW